MTAAIRALRAAWPDRGIASVLAARVLPLAAAPVALVLVTATRPPAEHGFYFMLLNLQALASLAEVGLGTLAVQFAARESAGLRWTARDLEGDRDALRRLRAVTVAAVRWYAAAGGVLLLLSPILLSWLRAQGARGGVSVAAPLSATLVLTALYLPLVPLVAAAEGTGLLVPVHAMRLAQSAAALVALWVGIPTVGALWAVAWMSAAWLGVAALWVALRVRRFAVGLVSAGGASSTGAGLVAEYRRSQRRAAAYWLALWAAPQALVPIAMRSHGPEAAGRVGVTLALATAAATVALSWLHGRYPALAVLASTGRRTELTTLARHALRQALGICAGLAAALAAAAAAASTLAPPLAARLLPPAGVAALGASACGWVVVHGVTGQLRSGRAEPLAGYVVRGILAILVITAWTGSRAGPVGVVSAYATAVIALAALVARKGRHLAAGAP